MNLRLAVGSALLIFIVSVALIIALGMSQAVPGTVVQAAATAQAPDVAQVKRDFLAAPSAPQAPSSDGVPPAAQQAAPQPAPSLSQPSQAAPAPQPPPQAAPAPQPAQPPVYQRITRAS